MANVLSGADSLDRRRIQYASPYATCRYTIDTVAALTPINLNGYMDAACLIDASAAGAFSLQIFHSIDGLAQLVDLNGGAITASGTLVIPKFPSWLILVINSLATGVLVVDIKAA